jgi:hypothetical protein
MLPLLLSSSSSDAKLRQTVSFPMLPRGLQVDDAVPVNGNLSTLQVLPAEFRLRVLVHRCQTLELHGCGLQSVVSMQVILGVYDPTRGHISRPDIATCGCGCVQPELHHSRVSHLRDEGRPLWLCRSCVQSTIHLTAYRSYSELRIVCRRGCSARRAGTKAAANSSRAGAVVVTWTCGALFSFERTCGIRFYGQTTMVSLSKWIIIFSSPLPVVHDVTKLSIKSSRRTPVRILRCSKTRKADRLCLPFCISLHYTRCLLMFTLQWIRQDIASKITRALVWYLGSESRCNTCTYAGFLDSHYSGSSWEGFHSLMVYLIIFTKDFIRSEREAWVQMFCIVWIHYMHWPRWSQSQRFWRWLDQRICWIW